MSARATPASSSSRADQDPRPILASGAVIQNPTRRRRDDGKDPGYVAGPLRQHLEIGSSHLGGILKGVAGQVDGHVVVNKAGLASESAGVPRDLLSVAQIDDGGYL